MVLLGKKNRILYNLHPFKKEKRCFPRFSFMNRRTFVTFSKGAIFYELTQGTYFSVHI